MLQCLPEDSLPVAFYKLYIGLPDEIKEGPAEWGREGLWSEGILMQSRRIAFCN